MSNKRIYFFTDVETTGFNFNRNAEFRENQLLELAYILVDLDENKELENNYHTFKVDIEKAKSQMDSYVTEMHSSTGLIEKLEKGECLEWYYSVDMEIAELLETYKQKGYVIIPAGNNVGFDLEVIRRYLPNTFSKLYYGTLDASGIRRFLNIVDPELEGRVYNIKQSNHNALVDIRECVKEINLYLNWIKESNKTNSLNTIG